MYRNGIQQVWYFWRGVMIFRISFLVARLNVPICVLLGGRRSETGRHVSGSAVVSDSVSELLVGSIFPWKKFEKLLTSIVRLSCSGKAVGFHIFNSLSTMLKSFYWSPSQSSNLLFLITLSLHYLRVFSLSLSSSNAGPISTVSLLFLDFLSNRFLLFFAFAIFLFIHGILPLIPTFVIFSGAYLP